MNKLIFIEPYASIGAHPYRNAVEFPDKLFNLGVDFEMIVEKDVDLPSRRVTSLWIKNYDLYRNPLDIVIKTKAEEFKKILSRYSKATYLFLTTHSEDLQAWKIILKDINIRKRLFLIIVSLLFTAVLFSMTI